MFDMDQKIDFQAQENATKMIVYVKKAAEMTHTVIMADQKASKAVSAIQTQDKSKKWTVLQEYYGAFINETRRLTGICVCPVDKGFYDTVGVQELNQQLQMVIGIVYLKEAFRAAINATYKECLKKLLKQSGLFTEAQLNFL